MHLRRSLIFFGKCLSSALPAFSGFVSLLSRGVLLVCVGPSPSSDLSFANSCWAVSCLFLGLPSGVAASPSRPPRPPDGGREVLLQARLLLLPFKPEGERGKERRLTLARPLLRPLTCMAGRSIDVPRGGGGCGQPGPRTAASVCHSH